MDGILDLHEVIHEVIIKLQKAIFKIDFEKAYDMLNREFLQEAL